MSRVGKKPVLLPESVKLELLEKNNLKISGPLGVLLLPMFNFLSVDRIDNEIILVLNGQAPPSKSELSKFGLFRSLLNNAVLGVSTGFIKEIELEGIGYRVQANGDSLHFSLGYSHPVIFNCPQGISFEVESQTKLKVKGIDKELVGRISSQIKLLRKKDSYKAKGLHFLGEIRKKKPGKSVKK